MHGTKKVDVAADATATRPVVKITGGQFPPEFAVVLKRAASSGIVPAAIDVLLRGIEKDDTTDSVVFSESATGPQALKAGTRFQVTENGVVVFNGGLGKRADLARALRLVVFDDRSILRRIPLHGCVIYDVDAGAVRFNAARPLRYNPFGAGNCIEVELEGVDWPVPLHTWTARADAKLAATPYDPSGDEYPQYTFWTPLRVLRNLWYRVAYLWKSEGYDGLEILPNTVRWDAETLAFTTGEMGKKCPDFSVADSGPLAPRSIAGLIEKACNLAGVIGWTLHYDENDKSNIVFFPRVSEDAEEDGNAAGGQEIIVQTEGKPTDAKVAFDWVAEDDWTEAVFRAWVDGKPLTVEAEFKFEPPLGEDDERVDPDEDTVSTLEKAWTDEDEEGFAAIVNGEEGEEEELRYAIVDEVVQNGKNGTVKVIANTAEAVNLARQRYPNVWRAFRLKIGDALTTILKGVSNAFNDYLNHNATVARPILQEQVQNVYDPVNGTVTELRYAPRVLVSASAASTDYHDVTANPGWFVSDDGIIRMDGLTDNMAQPSDRIYDGDLLEPDSVVLRNIKINAAIQLDARAMKELGLSMPRGKAYADPNGIIPEVDKTLLGRNNGPAVYECSEWAIEHQVTSNPTAAKQVPGLNDNLTGGTEDMEPAEAESWAASVTPPLTRVYRDESDEIEAAAQRVLKKLAKPERSAAWKLIGIRPDMQPGVWIPNVVFMPAKRYRRIGAPVDSVVYDYVDQVTQVRLEGF